MNTHSSIERKVHVHVLATLARILLVYLVTAALPQAVIRNPVAYLLSSKILLLYHYYYYIKYYCYVIIITITIMSL